MDHECGICHKPFTPYRKWSRYCSDECRLRANYLGQCKSKGIEPLTAPKTVVCTGCGKEFTTWRKPQKFCSKRCNQRFNNQPTGFRHIIPPSTVGAISELLVGADLLRRGYEVFRALSPSCSCDLAILKNGKLLRVEVRTGRKNRRGNVVYANTTHRHDVMAVVVGKDQILYDPEQF